MAENTSLMAVAGALTDAVEKKVTAMLDEKRLDLPADYSANNALKSMQLAITQCEDRNHKPALEVCTKDSIIQCMLSMVVQGLNPDKKQCYPIVYGNKLTLFRSYFGAMAVAKRVDENIADIVAQVVYKSEKDNFKMIVQGNGKFLVTQHEPDIFGSRKAEDIVGAYCTVTYKDGTAWSEFRNFDQIKDAWKHSATHPIDEKGNIKESSTHAKETEDMCRRTVINRACKIIINSSSDANIVAQFARETQRDMDMAEAEEKIATNLGTGEVVDIPDNVDMEVVDIPAEEPSKEVANTVANAEPTDTVEGLADVPNPFDNL